MRRTPMSLRFRKYFRDASNVLFRMVALNLNPFSVVKLKKVQATSMALFEVLALNLIIFSLSPFR